MSEQDDNPEVGATEENQAQFSLQRIYVKMHLLSLPKHQIAFVVIGNQKSILS
jgi:hypothetical protein